jgi:ATP-dependent Clp protease ATP-binding subunit ClpX
MPACSFCLRPRNEVKALIPAPEDRAFICDRCLDAARAVVLKPTREAEGPLPKPLEILRHLDEHVIAQDPAKKVLAAAVYKHYKRREAIRRALPIDDIEIEKSNILIAGPSGCGKTQLARTLARLLRVPFYVGDATKITQAGYAGDDVDSLLQGLLERCGWNIDKAKWGIIVLDEIDKLARKTGREVAGYRDVSGEGVQQALLKIIEGGEVTIAKGMGSRLVDGTRQETVTIDTTNILFIGMGSFNGIEEVIHRRMNEGVRLGFGGSLRKDAARDVVYRELCEEDILEFGVIPELAGRFPVLTSVAPLSVDDLLRVLTEPKHALVKQLQALYAMDDVRLTFDEDALRAIAEKAEKRETGARALRGIVEALLNPYDLTVPSDPDIREIRVTKAFVKGAADPVIRRGPLVSALRA